MTITPERRRELHRRADDEAEWEQMSKTHLCAECAGPLVLAVIPGQEGRHLLCGQDHDHQGFRKSGYIRHDRFGLPSYHGPAATAPPISALHYIDSLLDQHQARILTSLPTSDERTQALRLSQNLAADWHVSYHRHPREWPPPAKTPPEWQELFWETGEQRLWDCMTAYHDSLFRRSPMTQPPADSAQLPAVPAATGALSVEKPDILVGVVMERYPELTPKVALLFCYHALRLGLDPLLNEIYPTVFKHSKTQAQVLVPIISEQGMGSVAARAVPHAWNGPPSTILVTDPVEKEAICGDKDAWVWKALGRRQDWEPDRIFETYGWMTQAQAAKARERGTPGGELPGNQARVRAIKRWLMEAYPEATSLVHAARLPLIAEAGEHQEALDLIDAEYRQLPSGDTTPSPQTQPGTCPVHNKKIRQGKYGPYCPTKVLGDDGKERWCKGNAAPTAQPVPPPEDEPERQVDEETGEVTEPTAATDVTRSEEAPDDAPQVPPADLKLGSLADLFNACQEHFGLKNWSEIFTILNVRDKSEIADVKDAWATVCAHKLEPEA